MIQRFSKHSRASSSPALGRTLSLTLLALLAVALVGARCRSTVVLLPPLALSDPAPGATGVVRSLWLTLEFAAPIPAGAEQSLFLVCEGEGVSVETSQLGATTMTVNPEGLLPASSACSLGLATTAGNEIVNFQTASAGPAFTAIYERRDRNRPLPFPDDYFLEPDPITQTGLRPNVTVPDRSGSVKGLLTAMALVGAADADGWSPIGNLSFELSAAPDPGSLPLDQEASLDPLASIGLFDLTPGSPTFGQRIPFKLTIRSDAVGAQPLSHCLVLFPGIPLTPTGRYMLAVTNRVLSGGEPLAASSFFAELRDPLGPGADPEVVKAHPLAQEVMVALESLAVPIPRDDLALAVRLTVRSTDHFPDDVLAMREDVLDQDLNVQITDVSPSFGDVAAIVTGTFDAPVWRVGGFVARDAGGVPMTTGTKTLPFILALPDTAATTGMVPIVMYQHGNPGSAEGEVPGAAADFLAGAGFAVGGFTDVLNRTYADVAEQQLAIFGLVLAAGDVADFYLQTYAEQLTFLRVLQSLDSLDVLPLGSPDGVPDLDPSAITYEGISYGSNHGQAFLAYAPDILAAGLVVGAVRLTELLEYQDRTRPAGGPSFLFELLPSFVAGATPPDVWMGLSLFSLVYDRQDPHNHARFLYTDPINVGGSTKKASILVLEGIQDSFTSNNSTRSLAWLLGPIPHVGTSPVPVSYLPEQSGPIQANVDSETTAAWAQFVPAGIPGVPATPGCAFQFEGHYCAQTAPSARSLRSDFYTSASSGSGAPVIGP